MSIYRTIQQIYYPRYKKYFQSASIYLFASIFAAIIKILINPVMAMNLSHEDYAIIGYFSSFSILFLPMLNFQLVTYYLTKYHKVSEAKREKIANTIIISLLGIGASMSALILCGFHAYFKLSNVNFPFWPFALFIVFQLVFNNFLTLLQVQYRLRREAKKFAKLTVVSALLWLGLALLLVVVLKLGAIGSMGAHLIVAIIVGIYSLKKILTRIEFDLSIFKDAIAFCWPLFLSATLWFFLAGVDRIFLEELDDTTSFALYNIGMGIAGFFAIFNTSISQTFEPDIYKAIADNKLRKLAKIVFIIILINAIPVLIFVIFATPVTYLLTGGRYTDAADFARILSLKNISMSFYYSVITVIVGFGFTKAELGLRAIGALLCIILYKFLISRFGFYGAAYGQVISFLLMASLGMGFIYIKFKVQYANK